MFPFAGFEAEIKARPFGSKVAALEPAEFAERVRLAIACEKHLLLIDPTITESFSKAYAQFPRWAFYTDSDTQTKILRCFGAMTFGDDVHLHACSLEGTELKVLNICGRDVLQIPAWNAQQKEIIQHSRFSHVFVDPLGWTHCIPDGDDPARPAVLPAEALEP